MWLLYSKLYWSCFLIFLRPVHIKRFWNVSGSSVNRPFAGCRSIYVGSYTKLYHALLDRLLNCNTSWMWELPTFTDSNTLVFICLISLISDLDSSYPMNTPTSYLPIKHPKNIPHISNKNFSLSNDSSFHLFSSSFYL